jgi:opacity protein-like surface antigen
MKYLAVTTALMSSLAMASYADPIDTKTVTLPAPDYATGFYVGPEGGFSAYQALPDHNKPGLDNKNSNIGGFGGGKLGYEFDLGLFRPAIEADMFYNGFSGSWDREFYGPVHKLRNREYEKYRIDSGAFMENELVHINLGAFQPYVGAGIGLFTLDRTQKQRDTNYYSGKLYSSETFDYTNTSAAWQVIGGADYYLTRRVSLFAEYKFLNYLNTAAPHGRLGQQLVGVGVRAFF